MFLLFLLHHVLLLFNQSFLLFLLEEVSYPIKMLKNLLEKILNLFPQVLFVKLHEEFLFNFWGKKINYKEF